MSPLDDYLPVYQFSERHSCRVAADAATILDAVMVWRMESDALVRAMIALREGPMRLWQRHEPAPAPFGLHRFTLLERTDHAVIYALAGRFWQMDYGLQPLPDAQAFRALPSEGIARLVLGFQVAGTENGARRLTTETRVFCPDRASRRQFTPYWWLIRPVSGLLRRRMLSSIKAHSEGRE